MFVLATDPVPNDNSVVAGPIGFAVFIGLIILVALLCWSFTRQLKKVEKNKAEGVFGQDVADQMAAEAAERERAAETHDADA
ncbi:MAG: hypothetical protein FWE71_05465 [Nocardioidaceae bacterium]|nr:hypothetical protein [Nocardioidaceae bacterium]MCL2612007.1 hypothetical protein [Nocardioidaceae bacterium]